MASSRSGQTTVGDESGRGREHGDRRPIARNRQKPIAHRSRAISKMMTLATDPSECANLIHHAGYSGSPPLAISITSAYAHRRGLQPERPTRPS